MNSHTRSFPSILANGSESASRQGFSFTWSLVLHCAGAAVLLFLPRTAEISPMARKGSVISLTAVPVRETTVHPAIRAKLKSFHAPQPKLLAKIHAPVLEMAPALPHTEPLQVRMAAPFPAILPDAPAPTSQAPTPKIQTNVFQTASTPAGTRSIPQVQTAGFNATQVETKRGRSVTTESSGFTQIAATRAINGERSAGISPASFTEANALTPATSQRQAVVAVQAGFSAAVVGQSESARREAVSNDPAFRAVEILYKPRPVYTSEARQLRLEGDVQLEVIFGLESRIQVIRVLQSLGHGLDESAMAAANAIRFRPAQRHGAPVSTTASLRIHFELAY